jgi:hypothetical protein
MKQVFGLVRGPWGSSTSKIKSPANKRALKQVTNLKRNASSKHTMSRTVKKGLIKQQIITVMRGVSECIFLTYLVPPARAWGVHGGLDLHAVIAGLASSAGPRNCLALMSQWENLGGGMARVSEHDSSLDGLDYVLKGSGLTVSTGSAQSN